MDQGKSDSRYVLSRCCWRRLFSRVRRLARQGRSGRRATSPDEVDWPSSSKRSAPATTSKAARTADAAGAPEDRGNGNGRGAARQRHGQVSRCSRVEAQRSDGARRAATGPISTPTASRTRIASCGSCARTQGLADCGMATQVFADQEPIVLNFEDPADMLRKQQQAEEEIAATRSAAAEHRSSAARCSTARSASNRRDVCARSRATLRILASNGSTVHAAIRGSG